MVGIYGVLSLPKIKYAIQRYSVDSFEFVPSQRRDCQRIG